MNFQFMRIFYLISQLMGIIIALNVVLVLTEKDTCIEMKNCKTCIQTPKCVWCKDVNATLKNRCVPRANMTKPLECNEFEIINSTFEIMQNNRTQSEKTERNERVTPIHISPQKIDLVLRVGEPVEIRMQYLDAEEKPLDLYFLSDLSESMKTSRDTVAKQSNELAGKLNDSKVYFGFGSFVDKPTMPFTPSKIKTDPPYSFKNHQKLQTDVAKFQEALEKANSIQNLDEPEASLDAIMQAIACTETIGWRNNSRKLIILSTDGPFHIAGDGKLAGIVMPHDGRCHLDNTSEEYTHEKIMDYPSVGQLNAEVKKSGVYVIFAVPENRSSLYNELKQRIENSEVVTLQKDSGNIVKVITKVYNEIQSTLKLNEEREDDFGDYEILYKYKCNETHKMESHYYKTKKPSCSTAPNQTIDFTLTVKLLDSACRSSNTNVTRSVRITTSDLRGRERLLLNIKAICDCNCRNGSLDGIKEDTSKYCTGHGNLTCGICECGEEYYGDKCECRKNPGETVNCNDDFGSTCSGRGECKCDKCVCTDKRFTGDKCQYDSEKCENQISKQKCSGHGVCNDAKCSCNPGFTGISCNCKTSEETCVEPGSNSVCSDRGSCVCDEDAGREIVRKKCECQQGESYRGRYCHHCESCLVGGSECKDLGFMSCIECLDKEKALEEDKNVRKHTTNVESKETTSWMPSGCSTLCMESQTAKNVSFTMSVVQTFPSDKYSESIPCHHQSPDGCKIHFRYFYKMDDENHKYTKLRVEILPKITSECPTISYWIIGAVMGSILLIGIVTLLMWKVVTYVLDTREYARFEKEREASKFGQGQNPLWVPPTSSYNNPSHPGYKKQN